MGAIDFPVNYAADGELDTRGLLCPEPVMLLHQRVNQMSAGDTIRIVATDPSTRRDFARFCQFLGHDMVLETELDGRFFYLLRKGA